MFVYLEIIKTIRSFLIIAKNNSGNVPIRVSIINRIISIAN